MSTCDMIIDNLKIALQSATGTKKDRILGILAALKGRKGLTMGTRCAKSVPVFFTDNATSLARGQAFAEGYAHGLELRSQSQGLELCAERAL